MKVLIYNETAKGKISTLQEDIQHKQVIWFLKANKQTKKGWVQIKHFHGKWDLITHAHRPHTAVKRNGSGTPQPSLTRQTSCVASGRTLDSGLPAAPQGEPRWRQHLLKKLCSAARPLHRGAFSDHLFQKSLLPFPLHPLHHLYFLPIAFYCLLMWFLKITCFPVISPVRAQLFSVLLASASWVPRSGAQHMQVGME